MHEHLTIVRPAELGLQVDAAVRDVCTAPVTFDSASIPRISARLACGDHETIRALLRTASPAALLPLVLARFTAWTGDLRTANAVWHNAVTSLDSIGELGEGARAATHVELQRLATDLGHAQFAAQLHRIARASTTKNPVDTASTAHDASTQIVCDVAFDTLGLEPDAARGRLRVRPRIDRFDALAVRHIRMGDARLDMDATLEDDTVVIRVEQTTGSTPITVLLEPIVHRVSHTTVDGRSAELAPQPFDGVVMVPVQIVLDDVRTMVIHP